MRPEPTFGWEPIPAGVPLWSLEKRDAAGWSLRTIALPLASRKLLVASPIRGLPEAAFEGLAALGEPAALLAPNHFHHLGLAQWRSRFPKVRVVASTAALPRLRTKSPVPFEPFEAIANDLPGHVRFLMPEGLKNGEVWLRLQGLRTVTWVVSDAFFHVVERPAGLEGLVLRALGVAPGLRIGWTFKRWGVRDPSAYRSWLLRRIDADQPAGLVVGHGAALFDPALPDRLRKLAAERLS